MVSMNSINTWLMYQSETQVIIMVIWLRAMTVPDQVRQLCRTPASGVWVQWMLLLQFPPVFLLQKPNTPNRVSGVIWPRRGYVINDWRLCPLSHVNRNRVWRDKIVQNVFFLRCMLYFTSLVTLISKFADKTIKFLARWLISRLKY